MTHRWAALGTLLAYSTLGITKVAIAAPSAKAKGKDGTPLGPQALVVRRFEITSGTLGDARPEEYDSGELVVEDTYGVHSVKLPSGHMVLYPSTSLHHVRPVTRGARIASLFWIQSMVRDDGERTLLFDLDAAIQRVNRDPPASPSTVQLTGIYHNLMRRWAEAWSLRHRVHSQNIFLATLFCGHGCR